MRKSRVGIICRVIGVLVAASGLIPGAILLNPWQKANSWDQLHDVYFGPKLIKAAIIATGGLVASYLLFRAGSHLKTKDADKSDSTSNRQP